MTAAKLVTRMRRDPAVANHGRVRHESGTFLRAPTTIERVTDEAREGDHGALLVVHEEPHVLERLRGAFGKSRYNVVTHRDPYEALAALARRPRRFVAVLLPQRMSSMTGVAFAEVVRNAGCELPIVMLAKGGERAVRSALFDGVVCEERTSSTDAYAVLSRLIGLRDRPNRS